MEWLEAHGICVCAAAGWLDIAMIVVLCAMLMSGYPVAFSLAGTALIFAVLGLSFGVFDPGFLAPFPQRIFGAVANTTLIAVPVFILMGAILEKSKIAEELLDGMAKLFGRLRGGLGFSVTVVGALLAASTGIVGATVVAMGLLSLPTMLRRNYDPAFAAGSIAAAGTLGQIIPPSIALILLGDVISNAYQKAQLEQGVFAPETVSVGDLFAGALIPGLMLVGFYLAYQIFVAATRPAAAPAIPAEEIGPRAEAWKSALKTLPAPLLLIVAVLGSILAGAATPTEAASVGAVGALLIAGARLAPKGAGLLGRPAVFAAAAAIVGLIALTSFLDLRLGRAAPAPIERVGIILAFLLCAIIPWGALASLHRLAREKALAPIVDQTARVTTMVFTILIGAALFSLVFRGLGGDETVERALAAAPGGVVGAVIAVMLVMFLLGFFLDFIEITFVVVPLVAPALLAMGVSPVWLGVMMAVNLQTSFLTPPFGFALFYLRGVAPPEVKTTHIYRGAIPFIAIQLVMLGVLAAFPGLATWLPRVLYQ
ncbi:TRAP transporter large permease [Amphiplicatus metriothermophilus]|uniref:TRAP transporter, DctM subunit n=1 Tax=Amphiplicatus metriothermophilus TaxID=1519374 RepID=A0A239PXU3_9PROT|nr:TRAP transporter large permease subunit [Amphiplicatus metriothermophilus]MBB5519845.1 tripartite ATP-independent transporter DctM subunit [Amphiplicatus metriothermophilus]SNT75104.1 TRAP transporter, DctM subunit [Amphiplicatus metriothermophilus]